ncbi:Alpha/Beta hydrolase protein [Xylariales sp. PMI_506]|nr:Alpha/Beta hydrolase protein [Xylariales sp. PMI_506]
MVGVIAALIQDEPEFSESPPLVLIHDGGGTTINYYFLGDLDRHVWGISNETLVDESAWPNGISQMARDYTDLIQSELPHGPLILGGWSVGGIIALEMAHILAGNDEFHVLGVIMMDSLYPSTKAFRTIQDNPAIEWGDATTEESKRSTLTSIANSTKFAHQWAQASSKDANELKTLPPNILLRTSDSISTLGNEEPTQETLVLGWGDYRDNFFSHVLEVPGTHYSLFAEENVDELTDQLSQACKILETGDSI